MKRNVSLEVLELVLMLGTSAAITALSLVTMVAGAVRYGTPGCILGVILALIEISAAPFAFNGIAALTEWLERRAQSHKPELSEDEFFRSPVTPASSELEERCPTCHGNSSECDGACCEQGAQCPFCGESIEAHPTDLCTYPDARENTGLYWIGKATTSIELDGVVTCAPTTVQELYSEAEVERFFSDLASPSTVVAITAHVVGEPYNNGQGGSQ